MRGRLFMFGVCLLTPILAHGNDFPTQARVEYVLSCMDKQGGQSYDTLYACVCSIDKIASQIPYDEYVRGEVYLNLRRTPGEKGGVFRDPDQAKSLYDRLLEIITTSEKSCRVKQD